MNITDITPQQAVRAVFFSIIEQGDWRYLGYEIPDTFIDEDSDNVRVDLSDAIEETLAVLGVDSSAENWGDAADIVLAVLPVLSRFLEDTSE